MHILTWHMMTYSTYEISLKWYSSMNWLEKLKDLKDNKAILCSKFLLNSHLHLRDFSLRFPFSLISNNKCLFFHALCIYFTFFFLPYSAFNFSQQDGLSYIIAKQLRYIFHLILFHENFCLTNPSSLGNCGQHYYDNLLLL